MTGSCLRKALNGRGLRAIECVGQQTSTPNSTLQLKTAEPEKQQDCKLSSLVRGQTFFQPHEGEETASPMA